MAERIRITGGTVLNKRLFSPPKDTIRPASDLLRQAVFNMFGSMIRGAVFYDVFAGVGAVGLEAVSRGADRAIFVELDRQYVQLIRRNIEHTGFGARTAVRTGDAFIWGKHFTPERGKVIVFLGPPYPLFLSKPVEFVGLITEIQRKLDDDDWLVVQFPREADPADLPDAEHWVRMRRYGKTWIGIWRKNGELGSPIWIMGADKDDADDPEAANDVDESPESPDAVDHTSG